MSTQLYPHIIADPNILAGMPIVEGTQVPASALVAQVATGKSLNEVARDNGVRVEDVRAALEYAAQLAQEPPFDDMTRTREGPHEVPEEPAELTPAGVEEARRLGLDTSNMSPLGRRLLNSRAEIVASGEPLLTWDELDAELAERRGEQERDDA